MNGLSSEMLSYLGELAAGDALSDKELAEITRHFPSLVAAAGARGLADPGDTELLAAIVATDDDLSNEVFNRLCERTIALAAALAD